MSDVASPGAVGRRLVTVGALLVLAVSFFVWWNADGRRIRRVLAELESTLAKDAATSDLVDLAAGRQALELFAPQFSLSAVPYRGRIDRPNDFLLAFRRFRGLGDEIRVILADEELEIYDNATAWMLFRATVTVDFGDRTGQEAYRVSSQWLELDGQWRIKEIEVVEILSSGEGLGLLP